MGYSTHERIKTPTRMIYLETSCGCFEIWDANTKECIVAIPWNAGMKRFIDEIGLLAMVDGYALENPVIWGAEKSEDLDDR